jgi:ribokinase
VLCDFSEDDVVILQNETNMVSEVIDKASKKNMRIAFNAAPFTQMIKHYPLDKITWLFVNEIEGASLTEEKVYDSIAVKLREKYPDTEIILTLGASGSIYAGREVL